MSVLSGDYDSTCNTHNALRNISGYACAVTFRFKASADPPPDMHYGVVSLKECCDMVNQPVMRIPGNTGCEIQYCEVPEATSSRMETVHYGYATGSGTAAQTPPPYVTEYTSIGPRPDVERCIGSVDKEDLPDDVKKDIDYAEHWYAVRNYIDDLPDSEVSAAVTAAPAPASWTSAAVGPFDDYVSSSTATAASAAQNSSPSNSGPSRYAEQSTSNAVRIWVIVALVTLGIVAAL